MRSIIPAPRRSACEAFFRTRSEDASRAAFTLRGLFEEWQASQPHRLETAMNPNLSAILDALRKTFDMTARGAGFLFTALARSLAGARLMILTLGAAVFAVWLLVKYPPLETVPAGDVAVRVNQLSGGTSLLGEGPALRVPALHTLRRFSLRDQIVRSAASQQAAGASPYQSVEGLSLGVDLSVRWAVDPKRVEHIVRTLPADVSGEFVEPTVQAVSYRTFARYTVREIFSSKREEIQQSIEAELRPKFAADGIVLKGVSIGKVDLPADYRRGMERLLAEGLEAEKMRYTLELKEKHVRQTELEALADKARRETAASASASEQVIAAKAQEEAMRHVLPFKQKQIEQRQLEAEAEKGARIKQAEASAMARRIEAEGEADSRQKLADAEVYRLDRVGKVSSEQMAREGALLSRYPLLIQKTVADKLSDKVQVIIAPPGADGRFIGSGLIGQLPAQRIEADERKVQ
jgi:regulator of protease activity HflC (stomatin/prohibitin superfamily)